jgi:catechol-2,3-dioxygenase
MPAMGPEVERCMPITRLNHAVLYVRDVERSVDFYTNVLGFRPIGSMDLPNFGAAFLQAPGSTNDHDLGLFEIGAGAGPSGAGQTTVGLYHLAWEVDTLDELDRLAGELTARGALVGASDHGSTKALYAKDPDGIEFEVSWLVPADQLDEETLAARSTVRPLDIAREKERYGGTRRGGVGVSTHA